ncbi:hypothetical protein PL321_02385 [Caloramator sp. mosi_1]|nr:hypothetical protein [Caloramator sp. mosi_1]WDC84586.1 hypothetical protein PL321_02385 [Caloramator sp. mosi_1]
MLSVLFTSDGLKEVVNEETFVVMLDNALAFILASTTFVGTSILFISPSGFISFFISSINFGSSTAIPDTSSVITNLPEILEIFASLGSLFMSFEIFSTSPFIIEVSAAKFKGILFVFLFNLYLSIVFSIMLPDFPKL